MDDKNVTQDMKDKLAKIVKELPHLDEHELEKVLHTLYVLLQNNLKEGLIENITKVINQLERKFDVEMLIGCWESRRLKIERWYL